MVGSNVIDEAKIAPPKNKKFDLLQLWRGLAAVLVALSHVYTIFSQQLHQVHQALLPDFLLFGICGVDIFFILSGFLIFYIHGKDIGKPSKASSFLLKRVIRIYPIYWIILVVNMSRSIGTYTLYVNQEGWDTLGLAILKAVTLFPQPKEILEEKFLGVSWTLSFEAFFYLIILGLIVGNSKLIKPLVATWFTIVLLRFVGIISIAREHHLWDFLFSQLHIEFALGCLIAYLALRQEASRSLSGIERGASHSQSPKPIAPFAHGERLIYIGLFLFTLAALHHLSGGFPLSRVITYGIPGAFLIAGSVFLEQKRTIAVPSLFVALGDASYAIYLTHGFVISQCAKIILKVEFLQRGAQNPVVLSLLAIAAVALSLGLGWLVYAWIEQPVLSFLRKHLVTPKAASGLR